MEKKRLTLKESFLVALTLFGMFFGAGNLIFPVHLGQLAGAQTVPAMIGFIVTAVGIPILGVAAIGSTHSDGLQDLANRVGKPYGYFFTSLLYLTIGPFFTIPRCATTSFTTGIAPLLGEGTGTTLPLLIFSFVFFGLVLFFSLKPNGITTWIGKIINPVFLLFLAILVVSAILFPSASVSEIAPSEGYTSGAAALFSGFLEGYNTMDAIAGLAFGIVVIDIIRRMGVRKDTAVAGGVLSSGILAGALMAVIYVFTVLMGAQSRGLFETSANGGIALSEISQYYLGGFGGFALIITITFACLKTSIGLVTSCSEAFVKMTGGKTPYHAFAIGFTLFSFAVSNFGLTAIIEYSLPALMFIYPLAITLILLALFGRFFDHDRAVYVSVTVFTLIPAVFDGLKTLPETVQTPLRIHELTGVVGRFLPFFDYGFGWVVPAAVGLVIGLILHFTLPRQKATA